MCIYKISNVIGYIYIGATTCYESRYNQYKRLQTNTQIKLDNSFRKYGFSGHTFEVIKECRSQNELFKYECYYIGIYNSINNGLNSKLPDTPSKLMQKSGSITIDKQIKYELSTDTNYVWTNDNLCFNLKTGRRIKQVYKNGSIGYCINSKFKSLKSLRPLLRKPIEKRIPNAPSWLYD
ncbi:MAG: hypothetical protein ACOWWH_12425 [Eubacteriaceae bacterium]